MVGRHWGKRDEPQPRVLQVPREVPRTEHPEKIPLLHRTSMAGRAEAVGQGAGWGREPLVESRMEISRSIRSPELCGGALAHPRKAEAWPACEGTKAADPKGNDFVLNSFLGKLLSWLCRGRQAGWEPV